MRYVEFEAGDKSYRLRYDFNAIADLEQQSGSGVISLFSEEKVGFHTIRMLLWAGLKWDTKGLTTEKTGDIINDFVAEGNSLEELSNYITDALQESGLFGDVKGGKDKTPFPGTSQQKLKNSKKQG
jgi:hypothetical protein